MHSVSILSVASLMAVAAAQPAVKPYMVTVTVIETVVKIVDVTSTVYANGGDATPTIQVPPNQSQHSHHTHYTHHTHHHHSHHSHPTSVPPPPETSTTPTPTPTPTSTETPAYTPYTPTYTPTETPTPTPTPDATTPTSAAPAPAYSQTPGGGVPSDAFSGDMTFYTPGEGSCGFRSTSASHIVALAVDMMNNPANSNDNPKCGTKITISYGGAHHEATVADTCVGCSREDIDLSPSLFDLFAPASEGRVPNVKWWFNDAQFM